MFWSALVIGFLGSFHCFGMCGPIALAIPIPAEKRVFGSVLYNIGRGLTYVLIGLAFGSIGMSFEVLGFNKYLSIFLGAIILLSILIPQLNKRLLTNYSNSNWMKWVKSKMAHFFKQRTYSSTFFVGMLNGLIPCGLIYVAVAGSMATANIWDGALYMILFSVGTMPAMFAAFMLPFFKKLQKLKLQRLIPALMIGIGLLFIYRGIAFEIPQIDPILDAVGFGKITVCGIK